VTFESLMKDLSNVHALRLRMLADTAEEEGMPLLAAGLRAMEERRAWPAAVDYRGVVNPFDPAAGPSSYRLWEWWAARDPGRRYENGLPEAWLRRAKRIGRLPWGANGFATCQAAVRAAALAAGEIVAPAAAPAGAKTAWNKTALARVDLDL
jgi:hypothetical protein